MDVSQCDTANTPSNYNYTIQVGEGVVIIALYIAYSDESILGVLIQTTTTTTKQLIN